MGVAHDIEPLVGGRLAVTELLPPNLSLLPAGTMLHAITVHDNTTANPRNPDPTRWVGYGQASIEEMAGSFISWLYLDDAEYRKQIAERAAKARQQGTQQQ